MTTGLRTSSLRSDEPRSKKPWNEAGTATVEDGTLAAMVLRGQPIDWREDNFSEPTPPEPIDGEVLAAAPAAEPAEQPAEGERT